MNITDESVKEAIHATIAKQILDGLDTSARDAILQKSIREALTDWKFRGAVQDVVNDKASEVAAELVNSPEWSARIKDTISRGFDDYLESLRVAMQNTLREAMHGKGGSNTYDRFPAKILAHWPEKPGANQ